MIKIIIRLLTIVLMFPIATLYIFGYVLAFILTGNEDEYDAFVNKNIDKLEGYLKW